MAVSKREKISGIVAKKGYRYQDVIVAYKLVIKKFKEINYESEGADYINDHYNNRHAVNVIEFYQCKYQETGQYKISSFFRGVLPTFINIYKDYNERNKALLFILETNQTFDPMLQYFFNYCYSLSRNRINYQKFIGLIQKFRQINTLFQSEIEKLESSEHNRFLRGIKGIQIQCESMITELIEYLKLRFPNSYENKLLTILGYIYNQNQGIISSQELHSKCKIPYSIFSASIQPDIGESASYSFQSLKDFDDQIQTAERISISNTHTINKRMLDILNENVDTIENNIIKEELMEDIQDLSESEASIIENKKRLSELHKERRTIYTDIGEYIRFQRRIKDRWNYAFDNTKYEEE